MTATAMLHPVQFSAHKKSDDEQEDNSLGLHMVGGVHGSRRSATATTFPKSGDEPIDEHARPQCNIKLGNEPLDNEHRKVCNAH